MRRSGIQTGGMWAMNRGEVFWIEFGEDRGGVIQKPRPAIIMTSDTAIPHLNRVQVVPLTTNVRRVYPGEAIVTLNGNKRKAMAT